MNTEVATVKGNGDSRKRKKKRGSRVYRQDKHSLGKTSSDDRRCFPCLYFPRLAAFVFVLSICKTTVIDIA